ncbi:MAG: FapA family protein [bacterium]
MNENQKNIEIIITPDRLSAYIKLKKNLQGNKEELFRLIITQLKEKGVIDGIINQKIWDLLADTKIGKPILVARIDIEQLKGKDARLIYKFSTKVEKVPRLLADGRTDYYDLSIVKNIKAGDILVVKVPPESGKKGMSIFGEEIFGEPGKDIELPLGENTYIDDNELSLKAEVTGHVVIIKKKVCVGKIFVIEGDVDFSVGRINSFAPVLVTGNVAKGFCVISEGDIEIGGNIEAAYIESKKGSVTIRGTVYGNNKGTIFAYNDIFLADVKDCDLKAGGKILIDGEVINCGIKAQGDIYAIGKKGVTGGEIITNKVIKVNFVNKGTTLGIQGSREERDTPGEIIKIEKEIKIILNKLNNLRRGLVVGGLKKTEKEKIVNYLEEKDALDELEKKLIFLKKTDTESLFENQRIEIVGMIKGGVNIRIDTHSFCTQNDIFNTIFYSDGRGIKKMKRDEFFRQMRR